MRLEGPLVPGVLVRRYRRFLVDVRLEDGRTVTAHCPNSGRLTGCTEPGLPVLLSDHAAAMRRSLRRLPTRSLRYTWELVRVGRTWVGVNAQRPNGITLEAITSGVIAELTGYVAARREVVVAPQTRLDLLLEDRLGRRCYVEVKNVTAGPGDGSAAFPDAVTARGAKHLRALMRLRRAGHRAAVVFVVQRGDCEVFRPWDEVDPAYGRWLRRSVAAGVEALPYRASVTPRQIVIRERLPLLL